jgi:AcrR family transcriptional regulator
MSVDSSVRPKQIRLAPEARRKQIVREATRLISQSGFNSVSLADIGAACGIRPQSVLHYFPTMNDILAAVLVGRDEEAFASSGGLPDHVEGPAELREYLQRVVESNLDKKELIRLFSVLGPEAIDPKHPAHDYFVQRNRLAFAALEAVLHWKPDPVVAARELLAFWQGLEGLWVTADSLDYLAVWNSFCDRFFEVPTSE